MSDEEMLYSKLNLLKRGTSFADILYTFGRYFLNIYVFIVDFNIILAK